MAYTCPKCGQLVPGGERKLVWHLQSIHNIVIGGILTESIVCGQNNCNRTFSHRTQTYKRHLKSVHSMYQENINAVPVRNVQPNAVNEDLVNANEGNIEAAADYFEGGPEDDFDVDLWDDFGEEEVERRAAMTIAGLLASSSVPHSTVTKSVQTSADLIEDITLFVKAKTAEFAAAKGILPEDEQLLQLMSDIESVSQPYKNLMTEYKQKEYFKKSNAFLPPQQRTLGIAYYPRNNRSTGNVMQVRKKVTFQYFPIKQLIKLLLEKTELLKLVMEYEPSDDTLFRDFHDGRYCKANAFLSSKHTLKLILYIDDVEVNNPLSPSAGLHKLGVVYFTFANIPPKYRSSLNNIFVLMMFEASDAKLYTYQPIFAQFIRDMNDLSTDGIDVATDYFQGNIKVAIGQVVGDNLGIHSLFGFSEGFTANFPCRTCKIHRRNIPVELTENRELLRTVENYEHDLEINNLQQTGVKSPCPLNGINGFHIMDNRAPDIMHDILEGICPLEVKLVLHQLIVKRYFSIDTLNARITSFNYGLPDAKNRPCNICWSTLQSRDGVIKQKAGAMWCLVRHMPLMLGDLVPENDEHWELILALLTCMDIIFAPTVSKGDTIFLTQLVRDHHSLFLELFPDQNLKPKHHYLTHYASAIQFVGPLIHLWVMRFEGFHNFSKRLGHIVCNFQNISKTLAFRNAMHLCYNIMANKTLCEKACEIGPGESVILASLNGAEQLAQSTGIPLYNDVFLAKWVNVHGAEYRQHVMVAVKKSDDGDLIFGKIMHIVAIDHVQRNHASVRLICELWNTIGYERHYHAYIVKPLRPVCLAICTVDDLLDFHPLHVNKSFKKDDGRYYINVRHIIG